MIITSTAFVCCITSKHLICSYRAAVQSCDVPNSQCHIKYWNSATHQNILLGKYVHAWSKWLRHNPRRTQRSQGREECDFLSWTPFALGCVLTISIKYCIIFYSCCYDPADTAYDSQHCAWSQVKQLQVCFRGNDVVIQNSLVESYADQRCHSNTSLRGIRVKHERDNSKWCVVNNLWVVYLAFCHCAKRGLNLRFRWASVCESPVCGHFRLALSSVSFSVIHARCRYSWLTRSRSLPTCQTLLYLMYSRQSECFQTTALSNSCYICSRVKL